MKANQLRKLRNDERGFTFLVPLTIAIVITFALLIVGAFVIGTVGSSLQADSSMVWSKYTSMPARAFVNRTNNALGNFSQGYSDTGNIIKVVAIITAIGMAIMAIVGIAQRVD
jgi:hypothetical protein